MSTLIKICGFRDPKIAAEAARLGAHYIGIVRHPKSRRYVTLEQATEIVEATYSCGAIPVLVYLDSTAQQMTSEADQLNIRHVQSYRFNQKLPSHLTGFYANQMAAGFRLGQDCFLSDNLSPGEGQQLDWKGLVRPVASNWFIAGGISPENIRELLTSCHPDGIDLSSGVETEGKKDIQKIEHLIREISHYDTLLRPLRRNIYP